MTLASSLRRLALLLVVPAVPMAFGGSIAGAEATWRTKGARPHAEVRAAARSATASPLATMRRVDERSESAVVLVVLDGVRWQDVFYGADPALLRRHGLDPRAWGDPHDVMPNLHRLVETRGLAVGAPDRGPAMSATGPQFISLPGYLEIFAGKPDPGCDSNDCPRPPARTIADDVGAASGPGDVALVASWPNVAMAASADVSSFVVTAGRSVVSRPEALRAAAAVSSLVDDGAGARPWPGEGDYRPDAFTAPIALGYLEAARPRFMFVGLGDADEYGHRDDYGGYLAALQRSDAFLGDLVAALGRMGARGRHTTVIVTTDHGRAYDFKDHGPRFPESGRVWLAAIGGDVRGRGLVRASRRYTLSDVAPTVMALLGVSGGAAEGRPIAEIAGARSM